MGDVDVDPTAGSGRAVGRRVAGWAVAVLATLTAVLYVLGTWNPTDLVVLWRWFGNPLQGAVLFFALALAATWLLAPVRSEAGDAGRMRWRIGFGLALLASLIGLGLFGAAFGTDHMQLARSPDGRLAIMLYEPGTDFQRLHVWEGTGLGARHTGDLGKPCGQTMVEFLAADRIRVSTAYGQFELRLDPASGRPLDTLGPTCSG